MATKLDIDDYTTFFCVEPEWIADAGWYYGLRYRVVRGDDCLIVTLAPDEAEFACEWWQGDRRRLSFASVMAVEWTIVDRPGHATLTVGYRDGRTRHCTVQLEPYIAVDWTSSWGLVAEEIFLDPPTERSPGADTA